MIRNVLVLPRVWIFLRFCQGDRGKRRKNEEEGAGEGSTTAMTTTLRYMPINCTGLVRLGRIALFSRSSGEYFHVGTTLQVVVVEKNAA